MIVLILYFCRLHKFVRNTTIEMNTYKHLNPFRKNTVVKTVFLFFIIQTLFAIPAHALPVKESKAKLVAKNFYYQRINQKQSLDYQDIKLDFVQSIDRKNKAALYLFNVKNYGFIIVSGDDYAIPVVAYDFSQNIELNQMAPNFEAWINTYADQIAEIWEKNLLPTDEIKKKWQELETMNVQSLKIFSGKSADPLLLTTWDQGARYNALCPADQFGPGGFVYAGCVAVAMAQVMNYYKHPAQGVGSYSYYHQTYGLLSADFGNATYDWTAMPNEMPNSGSYEIAELLYHCGVSVDMNYTASGSGAWSNRVVSSLENYFDYSSSVNIKSKSGYSDSQWADMVQSSIDNKEPLYYHGYPSGYGAGHAFNLDGYQGNDYFHFNWGWSGSYNGYYYLNNLNPGSYDFSSGQGAIFDIRPNSTNYPLGCQNNTLTATHGVIFDGSGPMDYNANQNCQWLISPSEPTDYIKLQFNRFDLDSGDVVRIYDGNSSNDSLLAELDWNTPPASTIYQSSGAQLLVQFISDNQFESDGFDASYESIAPVYCQGLLTLSAPSGTISDGSDTNNYNDGIYCRWMIESSDPVISLHFTSFNTESNHDWVVIYDPTTSPSTLLAKYSGNQIPPGVTATNGKMLINFVSNESGNSEGWSASYYTGQVGMEKLQNAEDIWFIPIRHKRYCIFV